MDPARLFFWCKLLAIIARIYLGYIGDYGQSDWRFGMIQGMSWRLQRAVDFRTIQRTISTYGLGNLLCGLLATVPITVYSGSSAVTEITGVAARRVAYYICLCCVIVAFLPN